MKLELRFTTRLLAELHCEAVVLPVFSDTAEEDAAAFDPHGRILGFLKQVRDFWEGNEGDTLLVCDQGVIPTEKILLKGLGTTGSCGVEKLARRLEEVGDSLQKMGVRDFGIRIPSPKKMDLEYTPLLEMACRQLLKPFMLRHREETGVVVRVVVSVDVQLDQVAPAVRLLESHFKPLLPCSIGPENQMNAVHG